MSQFTKFYFTSSMLNMFRILTQQSSGAFDFFYCIITLVVCSCFDVCWSFGVAELGWYPCCRLKPELHGQLPANTTHDYTNCCLYTVDLPDDEQQACSKHVEAYYRNKLIQNSAFCWFILYRYITMYGQQNV